MRLSPVSLDENFHKTRHGTGFGIYPVVVSILKMLTVNNEETRIRSVHNVQQTVILILVLDSWRLKTYLLKRKRKPLKIHKTQ